MEIKGKNIVLQPMYEKDKDLFYEWASDSDATSFWYGELYGDEIPSYDEFFQDWKPHYFTDNNPEKGRCFFVILDGQPIGQINYNAIESQRTEIDILIADKNNWNKGYGSEAIRILAEHLFKQFNVIEIWVANVKKNSRAINAYTKSGFNVIDPPESTKRSPYWQKKDLSAYVFLSLKKENAGTGI